MSGQPETKTVHHLILAASPSAKRSALNDPPANPPTSLPPPKEVKTHDSAPLGSQDGQGAGIEKARLVFVGTATCVLEWWVVSLIGCRFCFIDLRGVDLY